MKETSFNVFIPLSLQKSQKDASGNWRIGGVAATDSEDQEGERILMKGLDTSYLESGRAVFNWNHGSMPEDIVGEIDVFRKDNKKLYVEGFLYKGVSKAEDIYKLMKARESQSTRRLGFSVEGKIRQREDNKILKSWVKAVAITHEPVNPYTVADLVKSLSGKEILDTSSTPQLGGDIVFHNKSNDDVWQLIPAGGCVLSKALAVGHTPNEGGLIITPESLESDEKKETFDEDDVKKSMSEAESILYFQKHGDMDLESATRLVQYTKEKGELHGVH